uniref:Pept_C1 domain-containing protein n=1 Tax=Caenorhabditis tropicalis TaxID=1561998 RepID=A0A1I7TQX8_9PELO
MTFSVFDWIVQPYLHSHGSSYGLFMNLKDSFLESFPTIAFIMTAALPGCFAATIYSITINFFIYRFFALQRWGHLIHPIADQGDCGSSWAVSTTGISSDRLSIISEGRINASLSSQQLLSCNQHRQKGCEGGYLDRAWWYIRKLGVVGDHCYPYVSGQSREPGHCLIPKRDYTDRRGLRCPSGSPDSTAFKMTPPYKVSSREEDIQTELMTNGPVQATFVVHEDFFMYAGGVYQHSDLAAEKGAAAVAEGYHSVRVLG